MNFKIKRIDDEINYAAIDGIMLEVEDDNSVLVDKKVLSNFTISELPQDVSFSLFYIDEEVNYPIHLPYKIRRINENEIRITVELNRRRKFWDGLFNIQFIVEKQVEIIKSKANMKINDYYDQDDYITVEYSIDMLFIPEENLSINEIFTFIEKTEDELHNEAVRKLKVDIVKEMMEERKQA